MELTEWMRKSEAKLSVQKKELNQEFELFKTKIDQEIDVKRYGVADEERITENLTDEGLR